MNKFLVELKELSINNKYCKWYLSICQKSLQRMEHITSKSRRISREKLRDETGIYFEDHHILPRFIRLDNSYENMAILTAREHFICHLLLAKMFTGSFKMKATNSAWRLSHSHHTPKINSRLFQQLKEQHSKDTSLRLKGKPTGPFSDEHKQNLSRSHKNNPNVVRACRENQQKAAKKAKGKKRPEHSKFMKERHKSNPTSKLYNTPLGCFTIQQALKYYTRDTIYAWCRKPNKIITRQSLDKQPTFPKEWLGKTRQEVGFYCSTN